MHDAWQLTGVSQPVCTATNLRCGPAWLSHWRFRVQIITLISKDLDQDRWSKICLIMVHQKNRWIHDQSVFADSFDAPWSRQILDHWSCSRSSQRNTAKITLRLAYNTSDTAIQVICTLLPAEQVGASIHSLSRVDKYRKFQRWPWVLFAQLPTTTHWTFARLSAPHGPPNKCAKPYEAIKLQFLTLI